ncbi:hypothetical protein VTI74DRAFT_9609 [Chaetomium olivicolor]
MATLPLYDVSIGMALNSMRSLRGILTKAQSHPDAASFATARLHPDMFDLGFQVQTASNFCKKVVERLTGRDDLGVWADKDPRTPESAHTFDELLARVDKTIALLETVQRDAVDAAGGKTHTVTFGPVKADCNTAQYVLGYYLPNLMFHLTTAYDILRMKGVELGKADFVKPFVADFFKP